MTEGFGARVDPDSGAFKPAFQPVSNGLRGLALAGIAGIGGFVGTWAVRGAVRDGYSPIDDAISQLAAAGAPSPGWMTAGFLAFGIGVPIYAQALRRAVPGPAWIAATATGVAIIGVAASPLERADTAHYAFAVVGYATLAATPMLAARTFRERGASGWARWSTGCGVASALFLIASTADPAHGLTQRIGLGITDAWIVATAVAIWRGRPRGRLER